MGARTGQELFLGPRRPRRQSAPHVTGSRSACTHLYLHKGVCIDGQAEGRQQIATLYQGRLLPTAWRAQGNCSRQQLLDLASNGPQLVFNQFLREDKLHVQAESKLPYRVTEVAIPFDF